MSADGKPAYVGFIAKDPETGQIGGSIREIVSGWSIELRLSKSAHGAQGYEVKGYLLDREPKEERRR